MQDKDLLNYKISPSFSALTLIVEEEGGNAEVHINRWIQQLKSHRYERIKFIFDRPISVRTGWEHYEGGMDVGCLKVSKWTKALNKYQKKKYPDFPDNFKNIKHYYFMGHDDCIEVLAQGIDCVKVSDIEYNV